MAKTCGVTTTAGEDIDLTCGVTVDKQGEHDGNHHDDATGYEWFNDPF